MPSSTAFPSRRGVDRVVARFRESRGNIQGFPGFVCMEDLRAEAGDEVLVITPGRDREAFDAWVHSEELRPRYALPVPTLTLTAIP